MRVLDTDVLIDALAGRDPARAALDGEAGDVATTSVNVAEVLRGLDAGPAPRERREVFEGFVETLEVLAFGMEAARVFGDTMSRLDAEGPRVPPLDGQIAAIAMLHGATLVTRNARHFSRVPGLVVVTP